MRRHRAYPAYRTVEVSAEQEGKHVMRGPSRVSRVVTKSGSHSPVSRLVEHRLLALDECVLRVVSADRIAPERQNRHFNVLANIAQRTAARFEALSGHKPLSEDAVLPVWPAVEDDRRVTLDDRHSVLEGFRVEVVADPTP